MNTVAFIALCLVVFATPWENSWIIPGLGTISRVAGGLAFAIGVTDVAIRGRFRSLHLFHVVMVLFVVLAAASFFWTIDPTTTVIRVKTYAQLALLVWLVWELATTQERVERLLQVFVLGAYVSAVGTILSYLSGGDVGQTRYVRYVASGFNPNDLGATLALGIPMAWYLAHARARGFMLWVNRLYLPLAMIAILLTASRGAVITSVVALSVIPWSVSRLSLRAKAVTLLVLIGALLSMIRLVPENSWERLSAARSEIESADFGGRGAIWRAGLHAAVEHPWLGAGAGAFNSAIAPFYGAPKSSHNAFLSVLVQQGILGLALYISLFAAALTRVTRTPPLRKKACTILLLTVVVAQLPAAWDYDKANWLVLALLIGQAPAVGRTRPPARSRQRESSHVAGPVWQNPAPAR